MLKKISAAVIILLVMAELSLSLTFRMAPKHDFRTPDNLSHFFAGNFLTAEMGQWWFAKGDRLKGFAGMSVAMDGLWEVKDGLLPYEQYGRIGAEGYDPGDVVMNTLGGLFALRLHDRFLMWVGLKERQPIVYTSGNCRRPMAEFWPRLQRRVWYVSGYIGLCAMYNATVNEQSLAFPHRQKFYLNPRKSGFLETLNSESSFVFPWVVNAEMREYFPFWRVRYPAMLASVYLLETGNGLFDDRDVPLIGDREGYKRGDIQTGLVSAHLAVLYDILFYRDDLTCRIHYSLLPTSEGLGLVKNDGNWIFTVNLPSSNTYTASFGISF